MRLQLLPVLTTGLSLSFAGPLTTRQPSPRYEVAELLRFPGNTHLENHKILPNGHLLIGALNSTTVYTVDPLATPPTPSPIVTIPGGTSLFGITPVNNDLYAIVSGNASSQPHHYNAGSFQVHIVSPCSSSPPALIKTIPVPRVD
ncbi:hypothetical protein OQA88_8073 [Cercophora sp. LCS_1]